MTELSNKLKQVREKSGLNQVAFAEQIGVSASAYNAYEQGKQMPRADAVINICSKFDVSADWLLGTRIDREIDNRYEKISEVINAIRAVLASTVSRTVTFGEPNPFTCLLIFDEKIQWFFSNYHKMFNLVMDKTIDEDMFNTWLDGELRKLNVKINHETAFKDEKISEAFVEHVVDNICISRDFDPMRVLPFNL